MYLDGCISEFQCLYLTLCQVKKPTLLKQASVPKPASAPPVTDVNASAVSTVVPRDVTARGLHSECVVCQDAEVIALFKGFIFRPTHSCLY